MAYRSEHQAVDLRVTMAGQQPIRAQALHPRTPEASAAVQIGILALHVVDRRALNALTEWWNQTHPLTMALPEDAGLVGSTPTLTVPTIAMQISAETATGALSASTQALGRPVVRTVMGPLTLDLRDQRASHAVGTALALVTGSSQLGVEALRAPARLQRPDRSPAPRIVPARPTRGGGFGPVR